MYDESHMALAMFVSDLLTSLMMVEAIVYHDHWAGVALFASASMTERFLSL